MTIEDENVLTLDQKKHLLHILFEEIYALCLPPPNFIELNYPFSKEIELPSPFFKAFIEEGSTKDPLKIFIILKNEGTISNEEAQHIHDKGSPGDDKISEIININLTSDIVEGIVRLVSEDDNQNCNSWIEAGLIIQTNLGPPTEEEVRKISRKTLRASLKFNDSFE
jgi:hypothetical protein